MLATGSHRTDEWFLSAVAAGDLVELLDKPAREGQLRGRLTVLVGTSGSWHTTLAGLFQ